MGMDMKTIAVGVEPVSLALIGAVAAPRHPKE
jgi:hypothetical protein